MLLQLPCLTETGRGLPCVSYLAQLITWFIFSYSDRRWKAKYCRLKYVKSKWSLDRERFLDAKFSISLGKIT